MPRRDEALRVAALAGGPDALMAHARQALHEGGAQLADHLIAIDAEATEPLLLKADALTMLAEELLTATGRNYMLTVAQELRTSAP